MSKKFTERLLAPVDPDYAEFLQPLVMEHFDGTLFNPLSPSAEIIACEYLSRPMGNCTRYGGLIDDFFSIGQHSVLVAYLAPDDMQAQKCALVHDAEECFGLPDMATPIKPYFETFVRAQSRISNLIYRALEINPETHARIKKADSQALLVERRTLKEDTNPDYWRTWTNGAEAPKNIDIIPLDPKPARRLYENAFRRVFVENLPINDNWIESQEGFQLHIPIYDRDPVTGIEI